MPQSGARRAASAAAALALLSVTIWLAACSNVAPLDPGPNQRPTLEVTQAPVSASQPFFYAYELRWAGYDVDGRIDHFRYVIDPPTQSASETVWVSTTENRKAFQFRSDSLDSSTDQTAQGYHTIVLEAVDDRGAASAPVSRSFTSFTIAPTVQIVQPVPNHFFHPTFGPSFRLGWQGLDPDGRTTNKPVQYKFKLFSDASADFDFVHVLTDPDSLRRRYAPHFSEWDSVGGDTTAVSFTNLIPKHQYVAAVVAIDEVGAYSPIMSLDVNMLYFNVDFAGLLGPKLTVFNDSFFYTASTGGGFPLDPAAYIHTEAPAGFPIQFNWSASGDNGTFVTGYRWMLDGNAGDDTPRSDEATDLKHWSQYSPLVQSVHLPAINPSGASETHFFYVEAQDNNKQVSIAVVQFIVVRALFDRDLLVVDDTRLLPDKKLGTCVQQPTGVWPTAAELDTFFFARGGRPWKCYPAGSPPSPIGIFSGYTYDTLGTRFLPQGTLTLQQLSHYRHLIWYTDHNASLNINEPFIPLDPMSELRWLSTPGRSNPIGTWVAQGGQVWMFGGGVASSLQRNWEKSGSAADVFSNADGELVPGRFMYDVFGWRSEITARSFAQATKPPTPIGHGAGSPDYSALPDYLFEKTVETDDIAVYSPNHAGGPSNFYQISQLGEGLTKPNEVLEDQDPDPDVVHMGAVLDTIYESVGGQLGSDRPVMTLIHGASGQRHVFSGFQLWYWQRGEQIAILDWVLQTVWGLSRKPVPR
jgi:hypothetical protein